MTPHNLRHKDGFFISFEGVEGSGKTSQINTLAQALTDLGYKVITTREPGGTPEGESIRNLLVQREGGHWTPMAECLMLFAARAMHVEQVIKPALAGGKIVITDRFIDSTRAYQGYGHGLAASAIETINNLVLGDFQPHLTFILDIDPEQGLERSGRRLAAESLQIAQTEDRFESMDLGFHQRIRQGFLDIAAKHKTRCVVLDATKDYAGLAAQILAAAEGKLQG